MIKLIKMNLFGINGVKIVIPGDSFHHMRLTLVFMCQLLQEGAIYSFQLLLASKAVLFICHNSVIHGQFTKVFTLTVRKFTVNSHWTELKCKKCI